MNQTWAGVFLYENEYGECETGGCISGLLLGLEPGTQDLGGCLVCGGRGPQGLSRMDVWDPVLCWPDTRLFAARFLIDSLNLPPPTSFFHLLCSPFLPGGHGHSSQSINESTLGPIWGGSPLAQSLEVQVPLTSPVKAWAHWRDCQMPFLP